MSAHTPGPWRAGDDDFVVRDARGNGIAWCEVPELRPERPSEQDRANARLIAAAPELLAALIEYVERHEAEGDPVGLPEYEQAHAAIAKARGQP